MDTSKDLKLNEFEYCLAAHLAEKFAKTGFSLLDQATPSFPDVRSGGELPGIVQPLPPIAQLTPILDVFSQQTQRQMPISSRGILDESCDYLLSPISTSIAVTPDPSGIYDCYIDKNE